MREREEYPLWDEFRKQLEAAQHEGRVTEAVRDFLTSRIPESATIDYKWKVDLTKSDHKLKLARWIAGLANTRGGILLLGVKEDGDSGEPDPNEPLCPVTVPDRVELSQQITNVVQALVYPIPFFDVIPIPVEGGHAAIVVVPASPDRPHVVQQGKDHIVPVRRGTSTVGATREELDRLYADRLATRSTLEQLARQQYRRYLPPSLETLANVFIYVVPVGTTNNLISLDVLRKGEAYEQRLPGAPRWDGWNRLPDSFLWIGHAEGAKFDYPPDRTDENSYRAIAYRNGAIATWSLIVNIHGDSDSWLNLVNPYKLMAALHGTLAPWISFLRNLGVIATVEGIVLLNNVTGKSVRFSPDDDPWGIALASRFDVDPPPFTFSIPTSATSDQITNLCFKLFGDVMYAAGLTADFSRYEENTISAKLKRAVIG